MVHGYSDKACTLIGPRLLYSGLLFFLLALGMAPAQMVVYEDTFNGGVSGDGFSPRIGRSDTASLYVDLPAGVRIRKALLLAGRHGNTESPGGQARSLAVLLGGRTLVFGEANQLGQGFDSPEYGRADSDPGTVDSVRRNSAVHALDVSAIVQPGRSDYRLVVPRQQSTSENRYADFYLFVAYENPDLPEIRTTLVINTQDFGDSLGYTLSFDESRCADIGLALFCGYICGRNEASVVEFNGVRLGAIADEEPVSCEGPFGSFSYRSGRLEGLQGDNPDFTMNDGDALANLADILPAGEPATPLLNISGNRTNAVWAVISVYQTYEDIASDSIITVCAGEELQLDAGAGFSRYRWNTGSTSRKLDVSVSGRYTVVMRGLPGDPCWKRRSFEVRFREKPRLTTNTAVLSFGKLDGCTHTRTAGFTFRNDSRDTLFPEQFHLDSDKFQIRNRAELPHVLAPGASFTVQIEFSGTAPGRHNAQLSIIAKPCVYTYLFPVTAEKLAEAILQQVDSVDFGPLLVCTELKKDTTLTLRSAVGDTLVIDETITQGPFTVSAPELPFVLPPGKTVNITLCFTPGADGNFTGLIRLPYEGIGHDCIGEVRIAVAGQGLRSALHSAIEHIVFPVMTSCSDPIDTTVLLHNSGAVELGFADIETQAALEVLNPGLRIPPGGQAKLFLRFAPAQGAYASILRLITEPCADTVFIRYNGRREGPNFRFEPAGIVDFGNIALCGKSDSSMFLTLFTELPGRFTGRVESLDIDAPFATNLRVGQALDSGRRQVRIDFNPPRTGGAWQREVRLRFAPCNVEKVLILKGSYVEAELECSDSVEFGQQKPHVPILRTVVFRNRGAAPLELRAIRSLRAPFAIDDYEPQSGELAPGDSLTVRLRAQASRPGRYTDTLTIEAGTVGTSCAFPARVPLFLTVEDKAQTTVEVAHIAAEVGAENVALPLKLANRRDPQFAPRRFEAQLRFDGSIFEPTDVSSGAFSVRRDGSDIVVLMSDTLETFPRSGETIISLRGRTLLGRRDFSPVLLERFDWLDSAVSADRINGSISLDDVCLPYSLRRFEPIAIHSISPNPGNEEVSMALRVDRNNPTLLEVYNSFGAVVFSRTLPPAGEHGGNELSLHLPPFLARGTYHALLRAPSQQVVRNFVIIR